MSTRRYSPSTEMLGIKIDPLTEIRNAGIVTSGDVYWVSNESDSDHRDRVDALGRGVVKTSIQAGIDATQADQNDYVLVVPQDDNAAWEPGTAVDVDKDRVHLLSVGYGAGLNGYSNTVRGFATSALDTELVNVTGNGVEIAGFRFLGTHGTSADGTIESVFRTTGAQTWVHDSVIESNVSAGASDGTLVHIGGDGFRADNTLIGDYSGNHAQVKIADSTTRHEFVQSRFVMDAQATGDEFLLAGTGNSEYVLLKECEFINVEAGTAPASVVTGSATIDNPWIFSYCSGVNVTEFGTDPGVFVSPAHSGTASNVYNSGIAIGTSAVVAD